jgi:replicative DNA helicase Mcm
MSLADDADLIERFEEFYRNYYRNEIGQLAQKYPSEQRSLYVDWDDLYRYDPDVADDFLAKPGQMLEYAEEALRLYDLPVDVKLGNAHVRVRGLADPTGIRDIRADHVGNLVAVQGIVRKATDVRPKMQEAAFECQRCGTLTRIPQGSDFQEPHECQGCERQGPFQINFDQSEFVDAQKLRVQESPEGLRGGETPQAIDIHIEDDITGRVTAGDHVTATGILHLDQQESQGQKSPIFDFYMEGLSVEIEDEQFEDMDITDEDERAILELSNDPDLYEKMVDSLAPSIYGYREEKLAIIMQLFSGVRKELPDGSKIRGDLHMLLIGDPGTGKCVEGNTRVTLSDGSEVPIRELVESNLDDPKPVDDGVWDEVDFEVPSMAADGSLTTRRATKVWKREAPDNLYRIVTESGRSVEVTPSHPLFVARSGDTEATVAEELDVGQFVAVPRSLPVTGDDSLDVSVRRSQSRNAVRLDVPDRMTPWLARLLGYVAAEGYVQKREYGSGTVYVTNSDREILDDVADGLERLGLNYNERAPHDGKLAREIVCSSSEFVSFLESLDPALLEGSRNQRVPGAVMGATRPVKRGFLRALVDAEGTVSPKQREVTVPSTSRDLLEGVRSLLLSFGIDSQLRSKAGGSYRLRVSGSDFAQYVKSIGFVTERKQTTAEAIVDTNANTNRDVIPGVGRSLREVRETLGLTQAECGLPRSTYQHYERGDRNPSRRSFRTVLETFEAAASDDLIADGGVDVDSTLESLRAFAYGDLSWDRIESIEIVQTEGEWVYDLEVEGTHNYLTNNVVSHNSQLLQYIRNLAPRSVYTSGKGSSSAGLTAAAVRDDFGDGQQWTLEAGALVLADQGIAAIDELDKMRSEDRSAMHEALEQQSYHPDTEVLLADGRRVRIGEFVDSRMDANPSDVVEGIDCEILPVDDVRVHSTDLETNETTKLPVDRVSRHEAPDEFVRVTFSNGRSVTVTPDHPMFVDDEGSVGTVEARDIEAGAFVPAPRKLPNSGAEVELGDEAHLGKEKDVTLPECLTSDLGEVLGFLVAEGHSYAGSAHEIGFSNQDERLLSRMGRLMDDVFGMRSSDVTNAAGTVTKRWISTKLYRWFERNFPEVMHTARDKRVPARVLGASEEVIRRFLVGAFAGDGGVESEAMSFSTASEELARDYADALAKIGVASRIHHDIAEDSWKVYVMGDSTERFVDQVVEPADDRYEQARAFVERSNGTRRHHDTLPTSAAREIRELRRLLGVRLTGQFRANLDEGYGVQVETARSEIDVLRERAATVREAVDRAEDLASIRAAIGWSGRQLADRLDGVTTSRIHHAEDGGYDAEARERLADRARRCVLDALEEFERRSDELEARCDLRFYRVTDVETVLNEGDDATEWVYDVTVEPTNTFVSQGIVLHNSISISKAGINATLKSRCSLLGAANPKYGRFDEYEPIAEQIDLEPALVSRFDLIFTITDKPDAEKDRDLAEHIIKTNFAGELHTHRSNVATSNVSQEEVDSVTEEVEPAIEADLLRKYVAFAKRECYPTMTEEAKEAIREFYVTLRGQGEGDDSPVPVTARKLEALVRLAEASARIRLSDTVTTEDTDRVIEIVRSSLEDVGMDPETGEFDADMVEAGTSKSQRDRIKNVKGIIRELQEEYERGAPFEEVIDRAEQAGIDRSKVEHEIQKLKNKGDIYEPQTDHLRVV